MLNACGPITVHHATACIAQQPREHGRLPIVTWQTVIGPVHSRSPWVKASQDPDSDLLRSLSLEVPSLIGWAVDCSSLAAATYGKYYQWQGVGHNKGQGLSLYKTFF